MVWMEADTEKLAQQMKSTYLSDKNTKTLSDY